jgi:phenylpyruvate tautomerase PptA (4-oxalocrotonate tautomerase family)
LLGELLEARDDGAFGADTGPGDRAGDRRRLTLEDGFDATVGQVAHPSTHADIERSPSGRVAKEDALNSPVDDHSHAFFRHAGLLDEFEPAGIVVLPKDEELIVPIVRIDIQAGKSTVYKRDILHGVRSAITSALVVPDDRVMQRLIETAVEDIDTTEGRSDRLTIIEVSMLPGRGTELKSALYAAIVENLGEKPGIHQRDIMVLVNDPSAECFALGGVMQCTMSPGAENEPIDADDDADDEAVDLLPDDESAIDEPAEAEPASGDAASATDEDATASDTEPTD